MGSLSTLASLAATREVLADHGLTAKYSLGQNFLVNDTIVQKIVALAELDGADRVLEIGPGIGTLTMALLKGAAHVTSIERDADLPAVLEETLAPWWDKFTLIQKDALDLQLSDLNAQAMPTKLVANLPYAVAATVVLDYFQRIDSLQSATVMVQKEVADRMAAEPGTKNYGAYTVKLRLYAQPAGRFPVSPNNFFPPPRVDSAVIRLNRRPVTDASGAPLDANVVRAACTMADAAFASRRKTLSNSCKTYFAGRGAQGGAVAQHLPELFERASIDPKRRGETLSLAEFVQLGQELLAVQAQLGQ
ncbi:16S rRNA (adenine(1518)-N(6)/adenine(1519)-N(6))-dimethyltransferase RsmA [Senegalimassilia faecalis]|uniref:Ribosomal RNA small subunit methyltransferase A n=1 Tax=Senegalimassilia faecalis TaxID=2509433 RepID=A0A4Q2K2V1_9ACTN|nr:16S rRNA (adenine(1518)-N(6)/adenine(1519)-N(6))-dimethyltransferase RsmA [Senegalimassilia faecalis]RXZ53562.1 16S rRNA (adenine(1518)-N(6)/adenine(1519)-N(6))-dimethyltransferase RsmA [Senegalimassilia faecalis]